MDLAEATSLCSLPTELTQYLADLLDTNSLKSFRRTCKQLAHAGLRSAEARVPKVIDDTTNPELDEVTLIHSLVLDLQDRMPKAAAKVKVLDITRFYRPHRPLPRSLGAVRLPSLESLGLTGIVVTKRSLQEVLRVHKGTLKSITLADVALELPNTKEIEASRKLRCWTVLMDYIRKHMKVDNISLHGLTWHDGAEDELSFNHIKTLRVKYPMRSFDDGRRVWYRLSSDGVQAVGLHGVRVGLQTFVEEANKTLAQAQNDAADAWNS